MGRVIAWAGQDPQGSKRGVQKGYAEMHDHAGGAGSGGFKKVRAWGGRLVGRVIAWAGCPRGGSILEAF